MNKAPKSAWPARILSLLGVGLLAIGGVELLLAANHSGQLLGRFSGSWLAALAGYGLFSALGVVGLYIVWVSPHKLNPLAHAWGQRLERLPAIWRAIGTVLGVALPYGLLLSPWSPTVEVVTLRSLVFLAAVLLTGSMWVVPGRKLWLSYSWAGLLVAGSFGFTKQFVTVTDYPLKLAWSEGNRLWDYSLYFGRDLYRIVGEFHFPTYLTPGRHGLWGLPFLLPDTSIAMVRFWDGLMWTLPYLLLGVTLFGPSRLRRRPLLVAGLVLWTFLFLAQGPIYAPLVWGAVLLFALYQRDRLWLSLLATALACFYVGISRWTWLFAPAVWIAVWALLEQGAKQSIWQRLRRPLWLGLAGAVGGVLSQVLTRLILAQDEALIPVSLEQPLLWYRLLPNPTYPLGILINLAIAVGPLLALILYLARRHWHWDWLQWLAVIGSLLGFLAAGLVASVKIGGGSNLHNLDMFLVGLLILSAQTIIKVSERTAFSEPIADSGSWQQALLILVVIVPSWWAIRSGFPLRLPSAKATEATVEQLVAEVEAASEQGTVLMMDQRQLLTFGQLDIPLAMEYELKHVFNQAMGANQAYFDQYEADLAASRYSMIVTIPVKVQYQGRSHQFGEENDAFTRWVAEPMLEHYQLQTEFVEEEIWLMVPRP